ncbi:E3 ubiquitin-protein ligase DTX3L [Stegastes partitus]|uniref:E3 ubiquitin-protein ligase n=1 Tax=Stegastes partitus TaxID=144197 RepID=A0A3B5A5R8_9TELE|nr:PREDICTED: E3 ubiquitin-protein ligase DTX3L-like [Stegastes partitus]
MEFIKDVTIIITEGNHEDPKRLKEILNSYKNEKKDGRYKVSGSFEQLENLVATLSPARHQSSFATHGRTFRQDNHVSAHAKHLDVSGVVMDYISQKCADKLKKIQGDRFLIETQPDLRAVHSRPSSSVQVTFRPRHGSFCPPDGPHYDFVKQRFITLYQRTAADLQVTSIRLSSHDYTELQRKFPHLLFKPSPRKYEVTAMGPFAHIAKLKEFLSQNTQSSSKSPVNKGSEDTPSSRTLGLSPTCSADPEEETCPICMESILAKEKKTLRCKHSFCKDCLKRAFDYKPVCPTCGEIYGVLKGTQPDGGTMNVTQNSSSLLGYEKYGTIIIDYYIPSGIQQEEHPNPGQPYEGVSRRAYLPDSSKGRMILDLLRRAFDQRLIFTIGRSTTSGRNNMVTWNDIHHKTSTHGGPTHYGYPDPDYLSRVRDELKVKGIE